MNEFSDGILVPKSLLCKVFLSLFDSEANASMLKAENTILRCENMDLRAGNENLVSENSCLRSTNEKVLIQWA